MAIELIEGWDEFNTGTADWVTKYGGSGSSIVSPGAFGVGRALNVGNSNAVMNVPANARYTVGFAVALNSITADTDIINLREGGTIHGTLTFVSGGCKLRISRAGSIPADSGLLELRPGIYFFVEVDYTVHDSTGAWEVKVNGTTVISQSGIDTRNGGTGVINNMLLIQNGGNNRTYDDMYFCSGSTSFLGPGRVITGMPTGDGGNTQWTPNTGNRWAAVDEIPHNSDTDYIASSTSGQRNTFTFAALGITGTIKAVVLGLVARKDDAAVRQIKSTVRRSSTDYDGSKAVDMLAAYAHFDGDVMAVDPSDSGAWTVSDVDSSEFGVVVV